MQVFASMDPATPLADVAAHAVRVEAMGYDGIHIAETVHDAFLVALIALQSSSTLTVRTSVAVAFPRSPMVTALAAWDLAQVSGGRFSLGLGTQVRGNIVGRYSTTWSDPVARMEEYVGSLRAVFTAFQTGEALDYRGEHYSFTRLQPYFNPGPGYEPSIWLGGVNTGMCRLAGRVADGLVTHPTSSLPSVQARIRADVGDLSVIASAQYATPGTRERKRELLTFLLSTPAYRGPLAEAGVHGLDDAAFDLLVPTAAYEDLAGLLVERFPGVTGLVLAPPEDPSEDEPFASVVGDLHGVSAGA